MTQNTWKVLTGSVLGRYHAVNHINCQDAVVTADWAGKDGDYVVGAVCDGCSEGKHSEAGAHFGAVGIVNMAKTYLQGGATAESLPGILQTELIRSMSSHMDNLRISGSRDRAEYIQDYLLFTVMAVLVTPTVTVVFNAGDGVFQLNDDVTVIDQDNVPNYIAYHLVRPEFMRSQRIVGTSFGFQQRLVATGSLRRVVIATDGIVADLRYLDQFYGLRKSANVQRRLNMWSHNDKVLTDDTSVVVIERAISGGA